MAIPTDSADARWLREVDADHETAQRQAEVEHAERCRGGWLGLDDEERPVICPRCRPALMHTPCPTCSVTYAACNRQRAARRGGCCPDCTHSRRQARGATL